MDQSSKSGTGPKQRGYRKWLRRLGWAGFLFFLIKGILWLTVGAAILRFAGCEP